ncbi:MULTISPECIES: hypothetical protein [unclassified Microbacterium]|uniref:hypothetical protein n=1 Tax=unclassified Microbacterium TaxID=2609290 RepID=UPI000EAA79E1|nr:MULTISPECIES: hypothetical protein [unclassified Microbacterium]MBT2484144.1 hypothetical protein [Microbacterium sp. ISL-108]RKN67089.1 hypothetical protein D7252_05475 [Microbacterium sp. CGR2]
MVSDHEKQRARYLAGAEGAPPVPPPGGYRGARRQQTPAVAGPPAPGVHANATADGAKKPANALGWTAIVTSVLFALTLLGTLLAGGTDILYGVTMLALQLLTVAVIVAALFSPRGRMLGAIALVVALLFNVATVGGMSALQTSASGSYEGRKSDEQKHAEAYPAIKDTDPQQTLSQQSLEEVRAQADELFADIRTRLTEEFGYTWTQVRDEDLRPERNGYGGESMLAEYTSAGWATNEPIQDYARKLEVMDVIDEVVLEHGLWNLYAFNDPAISGMDPAVIAKLYGSDDPRTQNTWEYYTENYPDPLRFYANIYDLSNDPDGGFRTAREAQNARTGEPLEGLQLVVIASGVLSEADRAEFEEKLKDYPGF